MTGASPPGGTPNRPPDHEHVFDSQLLCRVCGNCALDLEREAGAASRSERGDEYSFPNEGPECSRCGGTGSEPDSGNGPQAQVAANANPGPAAQSPQEGAALRLVVEAFAKEYCDCCQRRWAEQDDVTEDCASMHHAIGVAVAELGRSTSDRPRNPESSPVASADPELAKLADLLRGARDELVLAIDSALSRLAGQSATKEEK